MSSTLFKRFFFNHIYFVICKYFPIWNSLKFCRYVIYAVLFIQSRLTRTAHLIYAVLFIQSHLTRTTHLIYAVLFIQSYLTRTSHPIYASHLTRTAHPIYAVSFDQNISSYLCKMHSLIMILYIAQRFVGKTALKFSLTPPPLSNTLQTENSFHQQILGEPVTRPSMEF